MSISSRKFVTGQYRVSKSWWWSGECEFCSVSYSIQILVGKIWRNLLCKCMDRFAFTFLEHWFLSARCQNGFQSPISWDCNYRLGMVTGINNRLSSWVNLCLKTYNAATVGRTLLTPRFEVGCVVLWNWRRYFLSRVVWRYFTFFSCGSWCPFHRVEKETHVLDWQVVDVAKGDKCLLRIVLGTTEISESEIRAEKERLHIPSTSLQLKLPFTGKIYADIPRNIFSYILIRCK